MGVFNSDQVIFQSKNLQIILRKTMKKIIITGASGLVGSTLINKIIDKKNIIIAVDNLVVEKLDFLKIILKIIELNF